MGWHISVDVFRRYTYIDRLMFTKEGSVEFVKPDQLHDRFFAERVSETKGEEEEEGTFLNQKANKGV